MWKSLFLLSPPPLIQVPDDIGDDEVVFVSDGGPNESEQDHDAKELWENEPPTLQQKQKQQPSVTNKKSVALPNPYKKVN